MLTASLKTGLRVGIGLAAGLIFFCWTALSQEHSFAIGYHTEQKYLARNGEGVKVELGDSDRISGSSTQASGAQVSSVE